jgi:hypothetical protein
VGQQFSDEQLHQIYLAYLQGDWKDWEHRFLVQLERSTKYGEDDLRRKDCQVDLWTARGITPVGPGESVNVDAVHTDPQFLDAIVALRVSPLPAGIKERGDYLEDQFLRLLALIHPRLSKRRPMAKLHRLFVALFPNDLHCCIEEGSNLDVSRKVLGSGAPVGRLRPQVHVRERLRQVLGPEPDLNETVRRSMFCWWLHETALDSKADGSIDEPVPAHAPPPESPKPLTLWPFHQQAKGFSAIAGLLDFFREVAQQAVGGADREDIFASLTQLEGRHDLTTQTVGNVIRGLKRLGMLEQRPDGQLFPTREGEVFLSDGEPDIFVERMLERVFGIAQLARFMAERPNGAIRAEILSHLRSLYPKWTTNMAPGHILGWSRSMGLIEPRNGRWFQTDYGQDFAKRLPQNLPVAVVEELIDTVDEEEGLELVLPPPLEGFETPPLDKIQTRMMEDAATKHLVFDPSQVRALHVAWHCLDTKRFVLLSGLSGTGKTQLAIAYSGAYCAILGLDVRKHRAVIAVSPDWRDPSGLLGYLNPLRQDEPTFQPEPALQLVLRASEDSGHPYFLVLDEMNLARVERYFAPFLSAMETREDLYLHSHDRAVNGVPPRVRWPRNLFIAGTVNMDETTHPFSDKVLDRAFTLEFWNVDLEGFYKRLPEARKSDVARSTLDILKEFHGALLPVRRHFGYRTADEVLSFVAQNVSMAGSETFANAVDRAIFAKVLPRLRGEDTPLLRNAFDAVDGLCATHELMNCRQKIAEMQNRLEGSGVTRFWA